MKGGARVARILLVLAGLVGLASVAITTYRRDAPVVAGEARASTPTAEPSPTSLEGARSKPADADPAASVAPPKARRAAKRLRVRVTTGVATGESPVVGASVVFLPGGEELSTVTLDGGARVARRRFSARFGEARVPAVTDGEGRVEIDGPRPDEPGRLRVVAEGFATEVRAAPFPDEPELLVSLRRGLPIVGEVVEAGTGYAPSGMPVLVTRSDGTTREVVEVLETDAAGRFRTDSYLHGEELTFDVRAYDGRTAHATAVVPSGMPKDPVVRLEIPGRGRCSGVVLGVDGKPVARAAVRVVRRAAVKDVDLEHPERWFNGQALRGLSSDERQGITGDDGAFGVAGLAFGEEYVAFAAPGSGSAQETPTGMPVPALPVPGIRTTLDRPVVADVRLRLRRHGDLRVRVTDDEGAPVRSARIEVGNTIPTRSQPAPQDGTPASFWLEPGRATVRVTSSLAPPVDVPVDVPEGKDVEIAIVVPAGARVEGVVVDRDGKPVARASVDLTPVVPEGSDPSPATRRVLTDGEGRFEVGSLERTPWRVAASTASATCASPVEVVPPARGLRLALVGHGRVVLSLLASRGTLPADVEVRRTRGDEILRSSAAVRDGRVELDGFDGTPETVEVIADGFAPVRFEVTVGLGETRDLGTMTLASGESLAGVVVDARGDPVMGAAVVAGHHGRAFADREGRFSFDGLPAGPLPVLVGAEGFLPLERSVNVGGLEAGALRLVLARGARVRGVVLTERGDPADGLRITLVPLDGEGDPKERAMSLRTDEDGSFEVRVSPGRWRVEGGEAERIASLGEVTAVDGESTEITLVARAR